MQSLPDLLINEGILDADLDQQDFLNLPELIEYYIKTRDKKVYRDIYKIVSQFPVDNGNRINYKKYNYIKMADPDVDPDPEIIIVTTHKNGEYAYTRHAAVFVVKNKKGHYYDRWYTRVRTGLDVKPILRAQSPWNHIVPDSCIDSLRAFLPGGEDV